MSHEDQESCGSGATALNGAPGPDMQHGPGPGLMGASTLIGNDVCNAQGEDLGNVMEVMLDMTDGSISYAVLSFGTILGLGGKLFAVPWAALELDTANRRFMLNVPRERLARAPGFNRDEWPDMADQSWANGIHGYYGTMARS